MDPQYWQALGDGDRHASLAAIKALRASGLDNGSIIREHILPAQRRLGDLWLAGDWSVAQEHAATAINEGLVQWLGSFSDPPDPARPLVVISCLEREWHALPALIVSEAMVEAGYRVNYLGGSPEPEDLLRQVLRLKPRAVMFSASLTSSLGRQKRMLSQIRSLGIPVVVGGQAFGADDRRALALGATAWCATPEHAVRLLDELPTRTERTSVPDPTPADLEAAWIEENRSRIVVYVVDGLKDVDVFPAALVESPRGWSKELEGLADHLVGCLSAAMVTDDETIMLEAQSWLWQVLAARGIDGALLVEAWSLLAESLRGQPLARAVVASAASYAEQAVDSDETGGTDDAWGTSAGDDDPVSR